MRRLLSVGHGEGLHHAEPVFFRKKKETKMSSLQAIALVRVSKNGRYKTVTPEIDIKVQKRLGVGVYGVTIPAPYDARQINFVVQPIPRHTRMAFLRRVEPCSFEVVIISHRSKKIVESDFLLSAFIPAP